MKRVIPLFVLLLVSMVGCAPWQYYDPNRPGVTYASKPKDYEMPILQRSEVKRPFKEIGQVSGLGGTYESQYVQGDS